MSINPENHKVLSALRKASEGDDDGGWRSVYLDNVQHGLSAKSFRSYLAKLSQRGLYRVIDGYAFGSVKMED